MFSALKSFFHSKRKVVDKISDQVECIEMQSVNSSPVTEDPPIPVQAETSWSSSKGDNWCLCGLLGNVKSEDIRVPVEEMKQEIIVEKGTSKDKFEPQNTIICPKCNLQRLPIHIPKQSEIPTHKVNFFELITRKCRFIQRKSARVMHTTSRDPCCWIMSCWCLTCLTLVLCTPK